MPTFNRERAKSELGWSNAQIDAYLASPQAQQDSAAAAPVAPPIPSPGGGIDPLGAAAGMGASALEAIGGPRTLLTVGGLGGAGMLLKKALAARGAKPTAAPPAAPPAAAPTAAPSVPTALPSGMPSGSPTPGLPNHLVQLTEEDIAKLPILKNRTPGSIIRRASLERMYEEHAQPKAPSPRLRIIAKKPEPTRPITTEGKPAKAPAASRGKSAPKLAREAAYRESIKPAKTAAPRGSSAARAAATGGGARHEVQYYSESKGKFVPIEDMHISQLRNAMNKLHGKLTAAKGRPSPVTQKQFEALKNEVTHRAQQAGELTVPGPVGKGQTAAAEEFERAAAARMGGRMLGRTALGIAPYALDLARGQSLEQQIGEAAPMFEPMQRQLEEEAILKQEIEMVQSGIPAREVARMRMARRGI